MKPSNNTNPSTSTNTITAQPQRNPRLGIAMMIMVTMIFAIQDGLSRYIAEHSNPITVVTLRYWFFALFVIALSKMRAGSIRKAAQTTQPILQISRGVLLVVQIIVSVTAFVAVGIVGFHTIFASYPLLIAALSVPLLGERVSWRRWLAIGAGFCGVLIIINPGQMTMNLATLLPLLSALLFAIYNVMTRHAARRDSAETSFFWTGVAGAVAITLIAPFFWVPPEGHMWFFVGALCITGVSSHFLLIKALDLAAATTIQPFTYFQLVFSSLVGVLAFEDMLSLRLIIGSIIVISAGLFTLYRERKVKAATRSK